MPACAKRFQIRPTIGAPGAQLPLRNSSSAQRARVCRHVHRSFVRCSYLYLIVANLNAVSVRLKGFFALMNAVFNVCFAHKGLDIAPSIIAIAVAGRYREVAGLGKRDDMWRHDQVAIRSELERGELPGRR